LLKKRLLPVVLHLHLHEGDRLKTEPVRIRVRNKPGTEGKISSGMNTSIEIDGKTLPFVTGFKYEVDSKNVGKATFEMIGNIDIDIVQEASSEFIEELRKI